MGCLKEAKLITDEKYNRLVRTTGFTEDETYWIYRKTAC